ncbi:MAG: hypothetical protein M3Z02_12560 [Actinomycetota bacterium]|nr:hypothetical protein [Actinomycetota bacterium]
MNEQVESWPDGEFVVRRVQPYQATKAYRCPGCDQEIGSGVGHVVSWPEGYVEDRRHWHIGCWRARGRRRPGVQRSRNAPRY